MTDTLQFTAAEDSEEIRELARTVRRFAEAELTAADPAGRQFHRRHFDAMAKLGLTGMSVPEAHGGSGLTPLAIAAALFEISRVQMGPAIYLSVHAMVAGLLNRFQSNPEHAALLANLADGTALGAFCLTEAAAGSDARALSTRAERSGSTYTLHGEKIYITSAGFADLYLVFARTGQCAAAQAVSSATAQAGSGAQPSEAISAFLIPAGTPGMTFGAPEKKMGCEGSPIASIAFDGCKIDESLRLGDEGGGYRIAMAGLNGGRINIAAAACGIAAKSIELAVAHLNERKQFDSLLRDFQGLQFMAADMYSKYRAAVLLTRDAALQLGASIERNEKGNPLGASVAKCFATDAAMSITTDGVQLLGGAGYLWDYGAEQLMRDAKMLQIVEGTNQIQRLLIARSVLGS